MRPPSARPCAFLIVAGLVAQSLSAIAADDGVWLGGAPTPRAGFGAVHDPVRQRMLIIGGYDGAFANDVWTMPLDGPPIWNQLAPVSVPPLPRQGHTAVYDPVRDRVMMFGGADGSGFRADQLWSLSLAGTPQWSGLAPPGTRPSSRFGHTAIYDPVRDRMLVVGGTDGNLHNDVWALPLAGNASWIEITPAGPGPSPRAGLTAIYDPVRDRLVMFGGADADGNRNDVWALSLAGSPAWTEITPAGTAPSARGYAGASYDPVRDRLVIFGGSDPGARNDAWALPLGGSPAWVVLAPEAGPPPGRSGHITIYDPAQDRLVTFGGVGTGGRLGDTWGLDLAAPEWSLLAPWLSPPSPRDGHTAIDDPLRDRMLVFGGHDGFIKSDVWAAPYSGGQGWTQLGPQGSAPQRWGHTAIYDPPRDRMVVFGGHDGGIGQRSNVFALSLAGTPTWTELQPTGPVPTARMYHTAIYDPLRDRMLVFGGLSGTGIQFNDVWALSLSGTPAWTQLAPAGTPPTGRYGHPAIYDPANDRMIVSGGGAGGTEVWALALAGTPTWSLVLPAGTIPPGRTHHSAIHDPVRGRMVMFGGGANANDCWALSLGVSPTWTGLNPAGARPAGRAYHTAIYDPRRDRMVGFGGYNGSRLNDTWVLAWNSTVSTPAPDVPQELALAMPRPNPSSGLMAVDFALREGGRVTLDVFDLQGRMVQRIVDGWLPAGRHRAEWRGEDTSGRMARSGVYLIALRAGGVVATRRLVRVD